MPVLPKSPGFDGRLIVQIQIYVPQNTTCWNVTQRLRFYHKQWFLLSWQNSIKWNTLKKRVFCSFIMKTPVTELEAGRACRATSGWDGMWPWRTGSCWVLAIPCWMASTWLGEADPGCWEGAEAVGRWGALIFSAINCSLILLIKTRLSSWQPEQEQPSVQAQYQGMAPPRGWCLKLPPNDFWFQFVLFFLVFKAYYKYIL